MATTIRLRRTGARNQASYRLVVTDSRNPRDGRFIEILGHYNPRRHGAEGEAELSVNVPRALYWLGTGAQTTDTVRSLLKKVKVLQFNQDQKHGIDVSEQIAELTGGTGIATMGPAPKPVVKAAKAVAKPVAAKPVAAKPVAEAAPAAEAETESE